MCVWSVRKKNCNWKHCLTPAMWTPLFKSLLFNKSTEFLFISMGTICTWQRAKALQWRRAAREAVCRQAAGDVSASWMPPHALCPWIYGCAAIGPDPPPVGGQRPPWCPVQLASWSCSGLPPTSWNGELHTHMHIVNIHSHTIIYTLLASQPVYMSAQDNHFGIDASLSKCEKHNSRSSRSRLVAHLANKGVLKNMSQWKF